MATARPLVRRLFFIHVVLNVSQSEDYVILKVTQDTTTLEAIQQVLIKSGKVEEKADNYMLVVETQKSWDHRETDKGGGIQRILDRDEKVLHAQSKWKGSGRFILRKNSNVRREGSLMSDVGAEWDSQMFVICVHNVSTEQPYTMLQAPTSSCAQDIVSQAMTKVRRPQDSENYVLCEEVMVPGLMDKARVDGRCVERRVLADDENVLLAQINWKNNPGKFVLVERRKAVEESNKKDTHGFLRRLSFGRLSSLGRERKDVLKSQQKSFTGESGKMRRLSYHAQKIWEWQSRNSRSRHDVFELSPCSSDSRSSKVLEGGQSPVSRARRHLFKPR